MKEYKLEEWNSHGRFKDANEEVKRHQYYIDNPDKRLSNAASNGTRLRNISEQTEEICIAAVTQTQFALKNVKNMTRKIEIAAVEAARNAICLIKNPSIEVIMAATKAHPRAMNHIENLTKETCILCIKNNPKIRQFIPERLAKKIWLDEHND